MSLSPIVFGILCATAVAIPINITAPPLCNFSYPAKVTIGTVIPLCVFVMSAPKNDITSTAFEEPQIKSMAFGVTVDTYSMLTLNNTFSGFNHPERDQDNIYAWVTGAPTTTAWARECALEEGTPATFPNIDRTTAYSCPQLVMTSENVVPIASLVAIMENGVLKNLIWDNECQTCPTTSDLCIAGKLSLTLQSLSATQLYLTGNEYSATTRNRICSVPQTNCKPNLTTGINCDFRILLTWQGTDSKGKRLTSSSLRMTQFSGQSVGSMWNSVANSFNPNEDLTADNTVNAR